MPGPAPTIRQTGFMSAILEELRNAARGLGGHREVQQVRAARDLDRALVAEAGAPARGLLGADRLAERRLRAVDEQGRRGDLAPDRQRLLGLVQAGAAEPVLG